MDMWAFLIIPATVILGCMGGQPKFSKAYRRWGIALLASGVAMKEKKKWRALAMMALGGILSFGYGEDSFLSRIAQKDWQRRLIYGLILSVPFMVCGVWAAVIALPIAFSVPIPFSFKIGSFEVLPEDILRYAALGAMIALI